jgi:hypothetical protein
MGDWMTKSAFFMLALAAFVSSITAMKGTQATAQATGVIRGVVLNEKTSEPIPGVQIVVGGSAAQASAIGIQAALEAITRFDPSIVNSQAVRNSLAEIAARGAAADSTPRFTATSDEAGRFVIEGVPPREYDVSAQKEGYFMPQPTLSVPSMVRTRVVVNAQQDATLQIRMAAGAVVSGRVTSESGSVSSNASVTLLRVIYTNGLPAFQAIAAKPTDDRGEYRLFDLPPGEYYLAATPRQTLLASPGTTTPRQAVVRTFYPSTTEVSSAAPVVLRGGDELSGMNLQFRAVPVSTVSGRVVSEGIASGGRGRGNAASLTLVPHDTAVAADMVAMPSADALINGPNDGAFRISNVLPGTYDLFATISNGNQGDAIGRTTVDVRGESVDGISVIVRRGADVDGRVIVDGRPAKPNLAITLQPADSAAKVAEFQSMRLNQAEIAEDGTFKLSNIPQGTYILQATIGGAISRPARGARSAAAAPTGSALPRTAYVADVLQAGQSMMSEGIRVSSDSVPPIEILIGTNGGTIDGTVVSTDSKPSVAALLLVPADPRRRNFSLYRTASAGMGGEFVINGVAPGQYPDFIRQHESGSVSVTVSSSSRTTQRVTILKYDKSISRGPQASLFSLVVSLILLR